MPELKMYYLESISQIEDSFGIYYIYTFYMTLQELQQMMLDWLLQIINPILSF